MYSNLTPAALASGAAAGAAGSLAFTGTGVGWFIALGIMLCAGGLLLIRRGSMRRARLN